MFTLEVTFRGMFVFVPDHAAGVVHALLPNTSGHIDPYHQHTSSPYIARLLSPGFERDLPLEGWVLNFGEGSGANTELRPRSSSAEELLDLTLVTGSRLSPGLLSYSPNPLVLARISLDSGYASRMGGEALWEFDGRQDIRLASELTWTMQLPGDSLDISRARMGTGEREDLPALLPQDGLIRLEVSHIPLADVSPGTSSPSSELKQHFAEYYNLLDISSTAENLIPRLSKLNRHDVGIITPVSAIAGLDDGGPREPREPRGPSSPIHEFYPVDKPQPVGSDVPPAAPEPVLLGASAPKQVQPGNEYLVTFAAYVKAFEKQAEHRLSQDLESSPPKLGVKTAFAARWKRGAPVAVELFASGLEVPDPTQSFEWDGEYNVLDFTIRVPADAAERQIVLTLKATIDGFNVGQISLSVAIGSTLSGERISSQTQAPDRAFVSYASKDMADVYQRVSSLEAFTGVDFFVDRDGLRMGERYEARLEKEITTRETFLLFWSRHAQASRWVTREWKLALNSGKNAPPHFQIHLLERVNPKRVPKPLRNFHLDDRWLKAAES